MRRSSSHFLCATIFAFATSCAAVKRPDPSSTLAGDTAGDQSLEIKVEPLTMIPPGSHGLAVGPDGRAWFGDTFARWTEQMHVYRYTPGNAESLGPSGIKGTQPAGLAWHRGSLYVCELAGGRVVRYDFDKEGKATEAKSWTVAGPWNVAFLPSGEIVVVSSEGSLVQLANDGTTKELFKGLEAPFDVEPAADGKSVWLSEMGVNDDQGRQTKRGQVTQRALDGKVLRTLDFDFAIPEGLLVDRAGQLWIADTQTSLLVRYDPQAGIVRTVKTGYDLPVSLAQGPNGTILVNGQNASDEWWLLRLTID